LSPLRLSNIAFLVDGNQVDVGAGSQRTSGDCLGLFSGVAVAAVKSDSDFVHDSSEDVVKWHQYVALVARRGCASRNTLFPPDAFTPLRTDGGDYSSYDDRASPGKFM
jgi:hypothetical protein